MTALPTALLIFSLGLAGNTTTPTPPPAKCSAPAANLWGTTTGTGAGLETSCPSGKPAGNPPALAGADGPPPRCTWTVDPKHQEPPPAGSSVKGKWYVHFCPFSSYKTISEFYSVIISWGGMMNAGRAHMLILAQVRWGYFTAAPPAGPSAEWLMQRIAATLPYPVAGLRMSPGFPYQVVQDPTWVWLTDAAGKYTPGRFAPASKSVTLSGYTLRWQIVPTITIDPGSPDAGDALTVSSRGIPEGKPFTCATAGRPWVAYDNNANDTCRVTFNRSGHFTMTATLAWRIRWTANGAAKPDITGPTKTITTKVDVAEIQSIVRSTP
jgi:hypothetical protein